MEITVYEESALLEISNFLTEYLSKNGDFKKLVAQLNKMILLLMAQN